MPYKRNGKLRQDTNKTAENWEDKRKCRNEPTKQRRLAIKEYWKKT